MPALDLQDLIQEGFPINRCHQRVVTGGQRHLGERHGSQVSNQ